MPRDSSEDGATSRTSTCYKEIDWSKFFANGRWKTPHAEKPESGERVFMDPNAASDLCKASRNILHAMRNEPFDIWRINKQL